MKIHFGAEGYFYSSSRAALVELLRRRLHGDYEDPENTYGIKLRGDIDYVGDVDAMTKDELKRLLNDLETDPVWKGR